MDTLERIVSRWLLSEDVGVSSKAICAHMLGEPTEDYGYPHDPSDLGRCIRLLQLVPEWEPRIIEMSKYGPGWAGLAPQWRRIVDLYHSEGGVPPEQRKYSTETWFAMKAAIADGYRNDPRYKCTFDHKGHLSSAFMLEEDEPEEELSDA